MVKSPIVRLQVTSPSPPPTTSPVTVSGPSPNYGAAGTPVTVTVKLTDPSTGSPLASQAVDVAVTYDNQKYTSLTTGSDGTVTYSFTPPKIGAYGFFAWATIGGTTYTSNFYVYYAGFDTFAPTEEYVLPVIGFNNVYSSDGQPLGSILSYGRPQGTLTVRDASTGNTVASYTGWVYSPGAVIYPGTGLPPGDYLFDFTGMTINHSGTVVKLADMTGLYMPLTRQGGIYKIQIDVYVGSLPTPSSSTADYSNRYGLTGTKGGNQPLFITQLIGSTTTLYDSSGEVSSSQIEQVTTPYGYDSVQVNYTGLDTGKLYTLVLDTNLTDGYYSTQVIVVVPSRSSDFYAQNGARMSSIVWGGTDSEYLFTGHWTNPAIIGKWGAASQVSEHGYANILGMTLTPTPSWGINRVWFGSDGYLYATGFGNLSSQLPNGMNAVYKIDPSTLDTVWTAYVNGGGMSLGYLNGRVYALDYGGNGAVIDASTGSIIQSFTGGLGGKSPAGAAFDWQFNEFHTDGTRMWRTMQGGKILQIDPDTLDILASSSTTYLVACYDPSTDSFFGANIGNCSSTNQYPNCNPAFVDKLDASTLAVTATWNSPFPRTDPAKNDVPQSIWATDGYVFVGYYFLDMRNIPSSEQRKVLNTQVLGYNSYSQSAPVDVLSASTTEYVGSILIPYAFNSENESANSGEEIYQIKGWNDGYVYINNTDANGSVSRWSTSDWSFSGLWYGPRWYENIVNSGTPAQPRPDGWEELLDFTLNKPIVG